MNPKSAIKNLTPFKIWLRPLRAMARKVYSQTLTFPYCGSRRFNTRIVLHPDIYFTHAKHRLPWNLLKRPVRIPLKIRLCNAPSKLVESVVEIVPGDPVVIDFRSILEERGLPEEEDYTFDLLAEFNTRRPNVEFQIKDFDCPIWGSFIAQWPSFRTANTGFAMINPKFKISDHSDTQAMLIYQAGSPDMPETNRIKYLICDELGEELVKGEAVVRKNSWVLVPTAHEREMLQGNCTMYAQAEQSLTSVTLSRDLISKSITLEHTQPLQKYVRGPEGRGKTYDLKEYWFDTVGNK